ncbi:hypothetical protein QE152_g4651 [Popillia japonica]|uniref:Fibrous sheath-interacting protein 1 n=1 Tax=Popillia japonica TaxID=7064 RepID=A0AAW1MTW0_POPJA
MLDDVTEEKQTSSSYNARQFRQNKNFESSLREIQENFIPDDTLILPSINMTDKLNSSCEHRNQSDKDVIQCSTNEIVSSQLIQPKRGLEDSLRDCLKDYDRPRCYLEGETKSTRHLMLEINEFYLDIAQQLRYLKGNLLDSARRKIEGTLSETESTSSYESELQKLITSIEQDDQKVTENVKALEELKKERTIIHQEIESLSGESEISKEQTKESNFQIPKDGIKHPPQEQTGQADKELNNEKKKNVPCEGKDFIAKNKELAKEYNMTRYCLTDEEKRRLQNLLSDIDVCEETNTETCLQGVIEYEKEIQKTSSANVAPLSTEYTVNDEDESQDLSLTDVVSTSGFNFDTNESQILSHLDLKLTDLRGEETIENESRTSVDIETFNELKKAEDNGKPWKFQLLQKRLKHIDRSLAEICLQKTKENEKSQISDDEDIIDIENIRKEYRESVCDISVDIEELEFEESKKAVDDAAESEHDV